MPILSGAEIQQNLRVFAGRWGSYGGTERSEVQTLVNDSLPPMARTDETQELLEKRQTTGGIVDLLYPGIAIIEMKAPGEADHFERHRPQALEYWHHSDDPEAGQPAPPFVVLCAFQG